MKRNLKWWLAAMSLTLGASTLSAQQAADGANDPLMQHMDKSVRPQDDFFMFANNGWFKANPIPASETSNGIFQTIGDTVAAQVHRICEQAAKGTWAKGTDKQKIGDLFYSGMDSVARNCEGIAPLIPLLRDIDKVDNLQDLAVAMAKVSAVSSSSAWGMYVSADDKQSSKNMLHLVQAGLSMPARRYYFDTDKKTLAIRAQFLTYAQYVFGRLGNDEATAKRMANDLLALETKLAKVSREREDLRDPYKNYNKYALADYEKGLKHLALGDYLKVLGAAHTDSVIVGQPEYMASVDSLMGKESLEMWKTYVRFRLINGLASDADDALYEQYFAFYMTQLRGVPSPQPRWKRVVSMTNSALGPLVGRVYVKEYLPKGTKEKLMEIGQTIRKELVKRIEKLDWMSRKTKRFAVDKLAAMRIKAGYPDKWKDMSALKVQRGSYLENVLAIARWSTKDNVEELGKPVDREEWGMMPQTYNAYYNPSNNEICVPGCNIIVPGFEGMPDDAVLYAIIGGSTFGHEMTHGFDDQGSLYDKQGNLKNWWSKEDKKRFDERTKGIVRQFDKYEVEPGLHINGNMTQGENIADLGGVILGLEAYKHTPQYKAGKRIFGMTPLQRYFLGYAQAWMIQMRKDELANRVKTDVHAPAKWRVLGPLENIPEFYEAFGVKQGDKMYVPAKQRVKIW